MKPRVVIVGGGFGGLNAAKSLAGADVDLTLIDRTNHHLFQPLLYQVATAALSPAEIAVPIRSILKKQANVKVILGQVDAISKEHMTVEVRDQGLVSFDCLIVATGARHSYFGRNEWEQFAPGLKSIADSLQIREKILLSFERAEVADDPVKQKEYLTFVIVGGGPTGVEMAGAIAEIAQRGVPGEFRHIDTRQTRIILAQRNDRILPGFSPKLSREAKESLESLGVEVRLNCPVTNLSADGVQICEDWVCTPNIIWAAGNMASPLLMTLDVPLDRGGRVIVEPDLSIPGNPDIFVIGDAAHLEDETGDTLPALGAVAAQQGRYVGKIIRRNIPKGERANFHYRDYGMLATVGRAKAVARIWKIELSGLTAWLLWALVHIRYLIGFRNKIVVMVHWMWAYMSSQWAARLITNRSFGMTLFDCRFCRNGQLEEPGSSLSGEMKPKSIGCLVCHGTDCHECVNEMGVCVSCQ